MDKCLKPPVTTPILRYSPSCLAMPEGLIPWIFGSGGFSGISARIVADKISVNPNYVRIEYPSYSYLDNLNCVRSSPKIVTTIRGYCCNGIPRLYITCEKGMIAEVMEYILIPNTSKVLAMPLIAERCFRKFAKDGEPIETTREALSSWLNVTYNEAQRKSTLGVGGFFSRLMSSNTSDPLCVGCFNLINSTTVTTDLSWQFIVSQYRFTPPGDEPFKLNTGDIRFISNDDTIGIVDTTNRATKMFVRSSLTCDPADSVIYEINGFMDAECFESPDPEEEDEHPEKDDPLWEKECPDFEFKPDACTRNLYLNQVSILIDGVVIEKALDQQGNERVPPYVTATGIVFGTYEITSFEATTKSVAQRRTDTIWDYGGGPPETILSMECKNVIEGNNVVIATFTLPVALAITPYPVLASTFSNSEMYIDDSPEGNAFREVCSAAREMINISSKNCDEDIEPPPQDKIEKPEVKMNNKGGNCFIKGKFTVSLTARVKVPKAFKKPLNPKGPLAPSIEAAKDAIEVHMQKPELKPRFEKARLAIKEKLNPT